MAIVETRVKEGTGKAKQPKHSATFVDLERGGTQNQSGDSDLEDIGACKFYASVCLLVLWTILVGVGIVIFMKIPVWYAVGLTSFIAGMMSLVMIMVLSVRDDYIEKRMAAENDMAPN
ncbi:unnamed protein product [Urochloa decumbens]|uniref:Uncharacterized protein n=1 Tax=Urochloa decumbens TaxID=240449 RepID=A0ABC8WAW5_9POAL